MEIERLFEEVRNKSLSNNIEDVEELMKLINNIKDVDKFHYYYDRIVLIYLAIKAKN